MKPIRRRTSAKRKITDADVTPGVSHFTIRRAKMADLPAVVDMSRGLNEIENYPGQVMREEDFIHFVKGRGSTMLVAVVDEEPVGYVTVYESENYFYLPYAVTRKEWRSQGVGSALLKEVEMLAKKRKVEYILMSVYAYNSAVHKFLKARGYAASKKLVQYSKILTAKDRQ